MTNEVLDPNRLLAEIGITEQQERAYRLLLVRGGLRAHEVSTALQLSDAQSLALLAALESKGLAMRARPNAQPCVQLNVELSAEMSTALDFLPATPEVAVEALILQRQAQLERTRSAIALLRREGEHSAHDPATGAVEVISGRVSIQRARESVHSAARSELRCLMSPAVLGSSCQLPYDAKRTAGVRYLHVVDVSNAAGQLACEQLRAVAVSGDECRSAPHLPLGVMIADRQLALLPLEVHDPDDRALLVRPSALLDGLIAMFEMIWGQAASVGSPAEAAPLSADSQGAFSSELEALIPLLAAGLNDKAIAHRLRISVRTLIRRVAKLLTVLEARSRFQAGWATALRLRGISVPNSDADPALPAAENGNKSINGNHTLQRSAH